MGRLTRIVGATFSLSLLLTMPTLALALECPDGTSPVSSEQPLPACTGAEDTPGFCCDGLCRTERCERWAGDGSRVVVGPSTEVFATGEPYALGAARDGLRFGAWTGWHRDGTPRFWGRFHRNDRVGPWTYWFPNGVKQMEGCYRDDYRDGPWQLWNDTGELVRSGTYDLEIPIGTWWMRNSATGKLEQVASRADCAFPSKPCEPRRVDGRTHVPARPVLAWLGFEGSGADRRARMQITNPHREPACVVEQDGSPDSGIERWTGLGWEDTSGGGCGNGIARVALEPGQSKTFTVRIGDDPRAFRLSVSTPRHAELGPVARVRSPRIAGAPVGP